MKLVENMENWEYGTIYAETAVAEKSLPTGSKNKFNNLMHKFENK